MSDLQRDTINRIVDDLRRSRRLLFITGAGFRRLDCRPTGGSAGFTMSSWTEENLPIETALSGQMMAKAPHIT
ncbi:MAG: hypothetical protein R3F37_23810 [Candidatus Competibacteraceae bacterium]